MQTSFAQIHVTNGSGKLTGIQSINTSTLNNDFCNKMSKTDSICKKCYAKRYETMRPILNKALLRNDRLLSSEFIPLSQIPFYNVAVMRFDSFGELINEIHFTNLLNIATKNSHARFTLWTKRKNIVNNVLSKREKPSNLTIIYSSPLLNVVASLPKHFDKVFTVFNKQFATVNNISINCGGKSCINCMICYSDNNVKIVNELVK